jgi:hypothetical protein
LNLAYFGNFALKLIFKKLFNICNNLCYFKNVLHHFNFIESSVKCSFEKTHKFIKKILNLAGRGVELFPESNHENVKTCLPLASLGGQSLDPIPFAFPVPSLPAK